MQCEKYTQAAFMTLSPDNIFRITESVITTDTINIPNYGNLFFRRTS